MNSKKVIASIMAALSLATFPGVASSVSVLPAVTTTLTASAASPVCTMWVKDLNGHYLQCSLTTDGLAEVLSGEVYGGTLSIPPTVDYRGKTYNIVKIRSTAFRNSGVKKVDLTASNITYIGESAFEGSAVEEVILGYTQGTVCNNAFRNCTSLVNADLSRSRAAWVNKGTFQGCSNLTTLKLPNKLSGIDSCAFMNSGVTSVVIPQSTSDIQYRAFFGCSRLSRVEFEGSSGNQFELRLRSESFTNCPKLISVVFNRAKFNADIDVFTTEDRKYTINRNVVMTGYGINGDMPSGINSYVNSVCQKLLRKWNITYNRNASEAAKMQVIKNLAQHIDDYMDRESINEHGNAATVLSLRSSACGGFARTFYSCAKLMGMTEKEVLIGGDGHCHAWNYIKNNGAWYVVDCGWNCISNSKPSAHVVTFAQYETFLKDTPAFQKALAETRESYPNNKTEYHTANEWIVCNYTTSGASDESQYNNVDIRDKVKTYLSRNGLGPIATK